MYRLSRGAASLRRFQTNEIYFTLQLDTALTRFVLDMTSLAHSHFDPRFSNMIIACALHLRHFSTVHHHSSMRFSVFLLAASVLLVQHVAAFSVPTKQAPVAAPAVEAAAKVVSAAAAVPVTSTEQVGTALIFTYPSAAFFRDRILCTNSPLFPLFLHSPCQVQILRQG
jgi:hypothetical protein